MVRKPGKHVTQRPALVRLCFEGRAKLRLSPRTPQKHNHHLCNSKSQSSAKVFFHQRETKINAGRYSRRSIATAILNIDGVGIDGSGALACRPAFASTNAPVQIEPNRRARLLCNRSQSRNPGS